MHSRPPRPAPRPIEFAPLGLVCTFDRLPQDPLAHQYFKHGVSLTPLNPRNEYRPPPPPAHRGGEPSGIQGRLPRGDNAPVEPWRAQDGKFCKGGTKWRVGHGPHQSRERIYQVVKLGYTIWGTGLEDMGASGDVTRDQAGKGKRGLFVMLRCFYFIPKVMRGRESFPSWVHPARFPIVSPTTPISMVPEYQLIWGGRVTLGPRIPIHGFASGRRDGANQCQHLGV